MSLPYSALRDEKDDLQDNSFLPRLYLPLLMALCIGISWRVLGGGSDFWAHAAIGRWIESNGVPHQTLFLWSARQDWIAHSWLSQLWFYFLLKWGGPLWGPVWALFFAGAMTALTIAVLWRAWTLRGRVTILTPLFFALAIWCGSPRSRPRPELWSGLFFALLLAYLLHFQEIRKVTPRTLIALVLMFVLWTNFHGGVAAGLLLIAITAFVDVLQERRETGNWKYSPLISLLLCCVLAVCVNPFGLHYFWALLPVSGEMFKYIDEWKPVWKAPVMDPVFTMTGALLAMFALLAWLNNEKRRWAQGVWILVWALLLLSARRHMWMWTLVSLAVLAANSSGVDSKVFWSAFRGRRKMGAAPTLQIILIARVAMVIFLAVVIVLQTPSAIRESWPPKARAHNFPEAAARRFAQVAKGRRVFNDYEFSSYLQWRCAGQPPLYIDLLNAYPDRLLTEDYFNILKATPAGRTLLRDLKINAVFLRPHAKKDGMAKLAAYLDKQRQWHRVYQGPDGTIWLKNTAKK